MEIDRRITNVWTIAIDEFEIFKRMIDESIQENRRRRAGNAPSIVASDDDKVILDRYYRTALAELSALLARRTTRVGGGITSHKDEETGLLHTVYTLPMTDNHESELLNSLGDHCQEFLVARLMERWYGQGSDFGGETQKDEIRHILHYRRFPIERPFSVL